ncbi:MAG: alpha-2-macroglobulin family protein, partial [Candidatus Baltobacteraceae bacterium]
VLQDPDNATTTLTSVTTDRFGIFTLAHTFSKTQGLGYYTVIATGQNGNTVSGSLRVAEFKPPDFKMQVSLSAESGAPGTAVTATAKAAYLFGAPLQGGKAHATVTRSLAQISPQGWDDFSFGRQWFWPEEPPSPTTDVLQQDIPLGDDGSASLSVPVPSDLPAPMRYQVDVEATDVSNLSVADSQSFLALTGDGIIGLSSDTVGASKAAMPVRVIVTDSAGKPLGARKVHLDLQKMTYVSASQAQEGGEVAQQSVKYDSVDRADVTSGNAPVTVSLTPPDAGAYRVRATFDGSSESSATDIQVFAYGANAADFGQMSPTSVNVTLDKKKYKTGDTATALVASPFDRADVYFFVIRNGIIYRTTLKDVAGAPHIAFRVSPDMLPNAAVEAVVVRRGPKLANVKPGSLDSLARVGMTPFNVDIADRYLKMRIVPQHATLAPGTTQRVAFALRDGAGRARRGKIVAMAVNDAILQLSGYRLPDLVETVFADQPISTRFADNRENLTLQTPKANAEKGFGYGGGFLEGAAGTRVRTSFLPTAYFGTVVTDASGNASVAFNVPDDLTTWRVMAVAVGDDDAHFGTADSTFITTLPLMLSPLAPQFARPGDRMDIGASVMNQTGAAGTLDLRGTLTGALTFASGPNVQASQTQSTGIAGYRYPVTVGTPGPSTIAFSSALGAARDAFSVPFNVTVRNASESVIESGATSGSVEVPVKFDRPGLLQVTLANSVVPQFAVPAAQTMNEDGLGVSDSFASRLIVASALATLAPKYHIHLDFDPKAAIAANLHGLIALQHGEGGFGAYTNDRESEPFGSAYALEALAFAGAHGVALDSAVMSRARSFASDVLANPSRYKWCAGDHCKAQMRFAMLYALGEAGNRRSDFLAQIYAQRDTFDSETQIRLARFLLASPAWKAQGAMLADRLQQTVYVTGRYSVASLNSPWGWLASQVSAQSEMLRLLLQRHAPVEQTDGAVRALVTQQCSCGWPTIDMTASAVRALDTYAEKEPVQASTATVTIADHRVGSASFGSTASSHTFTADTVSLHGSSIEIRSSGGRVHYTVLYTYAPASDAPGALSAFRVTRTLADVGAKTVRATMDLAPVAAPVAVDSGHVFDIGLRVAVDHAVDRLVLEDPLPAGFEAVDTAFQTSSKAVIAQSDSWQIDDRQIHKDRVTAFVEHLQPGVYEMHYLVRSVTPGIYRWPGSRAYLQDAPEQFGRSASATLEVK